VKTYFTYFQTEIQSLKIKVIFFSKNLTLFRLPFYPSGKKFSDSYFCLENNLIF